MASKEEITEFLAAEFPQARFAIEAVGDRSATVRHAVGIDDLRPGGSVSGPVLMAVGDFALYVAILGEIGLVPLAVTTNMSIHFLRRPSGEKDILGECRLLKVGRSLVVGTYSIPPAGRG